MCCLLHSSGTCSFFSALCSEMQLFPPFLTFVPPYSLFIWINLKMCLHVIGDTHLRGLWHFPMMNILLGTFLQRPLVYACWSASPVTYGGTDWARISLVDHSKRFTKMYTPMCLIFPLHQGCEIYGSGGKSSLLLSLSLFWQIKLDWNTATNWLQTVCNCFCETVAELSPY